MDNKKNKTLLGIGISLLIILLLFLFLNPQFFKEVVSEDFYNGWQGLLKNYFNFKESNLTLANWGMSLCVLFVTFILSSLAKKVFSLFSLKNSHSESMKNIAANVICFLIDVLGIIAALNCLGIDTTALIVSIGIVGVIVGFGIQSVLEDIISGLMIVFDKTFEVGDYIALDGFRGKVTNIGIRSVKIADEGGNIKVIRNSSIGSLINLSDSDSYAIVNCTASVSNLEAQEEQLKNILELVKKEYPEIFKAVPEYRGVESVSGDNATLLVVAKVDEKNIYNAKRILNRSIAIGFRK